MQKIVIFDEQDNNVICDSAQMVVAFVCKDGQVKTVVCGDVTQTAVENLANVSQKLILNTLKEGEKNV